LETNGKLASFPLPAKVDGPSRPEVAKLGRLIAAYAPHDGSFALRIPGLHAGRSGGTGAYECFVFPRTL